MKKIYAGLASVIFFNVFAMHEGMHDEDVDVFYDAVAYHEPLGITSSHHEHDMPKSAKSFQEPFVGKSTEATQRIPTPEHVQQVKTESVDASSQQKAQAIVRDIAQTITDSAKSEQPKLKPKQRTLMQRVRRFFELTLGRGTVEQKVKHLADDAKMATTQKAQQAALDAINNMYKQMRSDAKKQYQVFIKTLTEFDPVYKTYMTKILNNDTGVVKQAFKAAKAIKATMETDPVAQYKVLIDTLNTIQPYILKKTAGYSTGSRIVIKRLNEKMNRWLNKSQEQEQMYDYMMSHSAQKLDALVKKMNANNPKSGDKALSDVQNFIKHSLNDIKNQTADDNLRMIAQSMSDTFFKKEKQ